MHKANALPTQLGLVEVPVFPLATIISIGKTKKHIAIDPLSVWVGGTVARKGKTEAANTLNFLP